MKITYEQVKALDPCYSNDKLKELLPKPVTLTVKRLLTLPPSDARWLVARLMNREQRTQWAKNAADRAKGYALKAKSDAYAYAAAYTTTAADAADAAAAAYTAYAAYTTAAAYTADKDAEHKLCMEDAVKILTGASRAQRDGK